MDTIYAVINGVNKVRIMQSGVLLCAHLACALLVHFASQVCFLSILQLTPAPSAQLGRKTQHLHPTGAPRFLRLMASINGIHCQTSSEW
jgi:hypothetical protein